MTVAAQRIDSTIALVRGENETEFGEDVQVSCMQSLRTRAAYVMPGSDIAWCCAGAG